MPEVLTPDGVRNLYRFDRTVTPLPSPEAVGGDAIRQYWDQGFLAVANVLTPEEVATTRSALDDLIHERVSVPADLIQPEPDQKAVWPTLTVDERADSVRKLFRFAEYEPRLKALGTSHPGLMRILELLLGEPCHMIQDMALLKPPHIGTEKPWHQDAAYFGWGPVKRLIGIWIALDPATPENGCMHLIPGSHRAGPTPHVHARDCQIPDSRVNVAEDVMVPLEPGGALFFSALVHHGTPPNGSPLRRWAVQYHYAAASCERMDRVKHGELFFEDGRYQGCRGGMGKPLEELEP